MVNNMATRKSIIRAGLFFILTFAILSPLARSGPYTDAKYLLYDGSDPEFINVYNIGEPYLPPDIRLQPLKASKDAIVVAVDTIVSAGFNDQIGAVAFSTALDWAEPLTTDTARVRAKLRGSPLGIGDELALGIEAGRLELTSSRARTGAQKMMVLVTDGLADQAGTLAEVQLASAAGITVHVIGVGDGVDTAWLNQLATAGGGTFTQIDTTTPTSVYAPQLQTALANTSTNQFGVSLIR